MTKNHDPIQFPALDDILVVAWLDEAREWRDTFAPSQIISSNTHHQLNGRRFRRAYFLDSAFETPNAAQFFATLHRCARMSGLSLEDERIHPIEHYDEVVDGYLFDYYTERADRMQVLDLGSFDSALANPVCK